MKRLAFSLLIVLGIALAQAWDFEVGREFSTTGQAWYGMARYNLPLTSEILGTQAWLLPEFGLWMPDSGPYFGYLRAQFIVDRDFGALFADYRIDTKNTSFLRLGVRLGWP